VYCAGELVHGIQHARKLVTPPGLPWQAAIHVGADEGDPRAVVERAEQLRGRVIRG
jgi:hypothetical protein